MVITSLTTLVANLFIELNRIGEIRKIYFDDIYEFNNILEDEVNMRGYKYYSNTNSVHFYELKYGYSMLFEVYEDENGYVVKIKDNVMISDLEECFRKNIGKSESQCLLQEILQKINYEEFFYSIKSK